MNSERPGSGSQMVFVRTGLIRLLSELIEILSFRVAEMGLMDGLLSLLDIPIVHQLPRLYYFITRFSSMIAENSEHGTLEERAKAHHLTMGLIMEVFDKTFPELAPPNTQNPNQRPQRRPYRFPAQTTMNRRGPAPRVGGRSAIAQIINRVYPELVRRVDRVGMPAALRSLVNIPEVWFNSRIYFFFSELLIMHVNVERTEMGRSKRLQIGWPITQEMLRQLFARIFPEFTPTTTNSQKRQRES